MSKRTISFACAIIVSLGGCARRNYFAAHPPIAVAQARQPVVEAKTTLEPAAEAGLELSPLLGATYVMRATPNSAAPVPVDAPSLDLSALNGG